jgi:hypothetical protein
MGRAEVEDGAVRLFGRVLRLVSDVDRSTPTVAWATRAWQMNPEELLR